MTAAATKKKNYKRECGNRHVWLSEHSIEKQAAVIQLSLA